MATPRQRRKSRSSSHGGPSARSKKAAVKKLKKPAPTIRGPEILKEKWDRTKTVRQNYAALGLVSSLQIHQSGGYDRDDPYNKSTYPSATSNETTAADDVQKDEDMTENSASGSKPADKGKGKAVKKGMARIIRDAEGNVVHIIEADDETDAVYESTASTAPLKPKRKGKDKDKKKDVSTPWGQPLNDSDDDFAFEDPTGGTRQLTKEERAERDRALHLPVAALSAPTGLNAAAAKNASAASLNAAKLHSALDSLAGELSVPVPRFTSLQEEEWLRSLVAKYGEDYEAASKDRKLNIWQRTPGEIKRAVRKAGGKQALFLV
ncbi:hypothetical protein K437DRAFT_237705 [Tilletiaria anomala UBC 951]|uniref:Nucleolar protein 16 n=1 Tax=Tilletiaria anomala (strain ATCC 24038 / CBS 436.72 / UBC 951) TaxID=1037660 RepID=A0A066VLZ1_TILAU|nr:uncharacterized protein K437DRAFT_237705 [Tilletiaria anomala UBC 951]KDN42496.1 hypothetical protein K437DRAFT_237705 [Tilletiaria anomala UBC 951]